MSLEVSDLPEKAAADMVKETLFSALTVSSWREAAYATGNQVMIAMETVNISDNEAERAYLAWEIVTNVVELTEMVATVWLNRRSPEKVPAHRASNTQIEKFWKAVRSRGVSRTEIESFLRLEGARGFSIGAQRAVIALNRVVENVAEIMKTFAIFWLDHADNARWFRHFPASLTAEEAWFIDPQSEDAQQEFARRFAGEKNVLESVTRMTTGNSFTHTIIRSDDARLAVALGDVALQLIMNWLQNSGLDPTQTKRCRYIFPKLTSGLTTDERTALESNDYILRLP